ncbi:MAG: transposase [Deltaproteobacteria bacterium]|nr:transposase [Deltaproteobacteria bacterium]
MSKRASARVRRTFTPQFKKDAVAMVRRGKTLTEVASSLGIARSLLQYWRHQLEGESPEPFPGKGRREPRPTKSGSSRLDSRMSPRNGTS